MKFVYRKMLRTLAISLFSLTFVGGLNADSMAAEKLTLADAAPVLLNPNAMQGLATAGAETLKRIADLEAEDDTGKQLEGIYKLLQDAQGKAFGSDVQEAFGKLVVKAFNDGKEIESYLQQVIQDIVTSKTPLLAGTQIDYVEKEMLPHVTPAKATAAAHEEEKAVEKKSEKKTLKKGKGKGGKKGKGKKAEMVDADGDGKPDEVAGELEKAEKKGKGKKGKGKKGKGKKAATGHDADTAPVATGAND